MFERAYLLFCAVKCTVRTDMIMSPDFNDVLENSSLDLTCYAPENATFTIWGTINEAKVFSYLSFSKEGACETDGFLADTKHFETRCYSNSTFKVKIKNVDKSYHGQEWFCSHHFNKSNTAFISFQDNTEERIQDSEESSNPLILLSFVVVGILVIILLAAVLLFFVYRYRRQDASKRQHTKDVNQITSTNDDGIAKYEDVDDVYEHLDERLKERTAYMEMQTIETEESREDYITPII